MAGRPRGDQPRDRHIQIRVTQAERALLDRLRGAQGISDYIRAIIFKEKA